eukprot:TRINITY_DN9291_c0_g1_i4.p6 TRINITY_DN9291_c0_g1~~TRINITY_DN9291_c0_g1_i4.p6  ORF type:complete len:101 (-),score=10.09 TRINITY_DN9291_c0_g1_i4:882-1184(-)
MNGTACGSSLTSAALVAAEPTLSDALLTTAACFGAGRLGAKLGDSGTCSTSPTSSILIRTNSRFFKVQVKRGCRMALRKYPRLPSLPLSWIVSAVQLSKD